MNRAFLIIFVPAAVAAAGYLIIVVHLGLRLNLTRFLVAGGGFLAAAGMVYWYRRRRVKPRGN